jgi:hypothetical protein
MVNFPLFPLSSGKGCFIVEREEITYGEVKEETTLEWFIRRGD